MRILNGIACVLLGLSSIYFMFIKAETYDDKSDIWSLGIILYRMFDEKANNPFFCGNNITKEEQIKFLE
jgi:serine/threonine protein kinase